MTPKKNTLEEEVDETYRISGVSNEYLEYERKRQADRRLFVLTAYIAFGSIYLLFLFNLVRQFIRDVLNEKRIVLSWFQLRGFIDDFKYFIAVSSIGVIGFFVLCIFRRR